MIDYESYNKIIQYLDKDDLNRLRLYLEKEKERYYLKNAKSAFSSYLRTFNYCDYIDENRILLTDRASLYVLNSDELLPQYSREHKKIMSKEYTLFLLEQLSAYEKKEQSRVGTIKSINSKEKQVFSEDGSTYHFFSQRSFNYSKKFLGENILYKICIDKPICLAESEKGKGLILGLKK